MHKTRKKLTIISSVFIVMVILFVGVMYSVKNVGAYVISGTEGGGGNSGCYKAQVESGKHSATRTFFDTCFGGTWMRYPADSDSITIPGAGSVVGGTVTGCKEAGFYYRLALLRFNTNGSLNASDFTSTGEQVGLWQTYRFVPQGGTTTYRYDTEAYSWNNIKMKYEIAKQHGGDASGNSWEDISWFCWNDDWGDELIDSDSYFTSTSTVSVNDQLDIKATTSKSEKDGETILYLTTAKYGETLKVNFWHNLQYNPGSATSSAQASTKWMIADSQSKGTWSTIANAEAESPNLAYEGDVEITIPPQGQSLTVCRRISYDPKYVTFNGDSISGSSGSEDSQACVVINKKVGEIVGEGHFWSNTTVEVPEQGDIPGYEATAEKDEFVDVKFSTDREEVKVTFYHKIFYDEKLWDPSQYENSKEGDVFDNICTNYDSTATGSADLNSVVASDAFCTNSSGDNSGNVKVAEKEYTLKIDAGEQVHICQEISHDGATVVIQRFSESGHYRYNESSRYGYGWSRACVTIDRPTNPPTDKDDDPYGPTSTGTAKSSIMFAGENATIGWKTYAKTINTRRLQEYKAIAYLVPVTVDYNSAISSGTLTLRYPNRVNSNPCSWYQNKVSTSVWCSVVDGLEQSGIHDGLGDGGEHTTNETRTVVVPDDVGYKYCNSYGYHWEYWYSISRNGVDDWKKEEDKDYWTNYDAACRTIAKKPSVAVWNGGVQANGGIKTSLSPRHDNPSTTGPEKSSGTDAFDTLYGSWTEYLAVVYKESVGFASGAALSRGDLGQNTQSIYPLRSTLTISNTMTNGRLGDSGVTTNTALRTRLESYLKSQANYVTTINPGNIVAMSGTLNITENIPLSVTSTMYPTIYDLPQTVIFVDGDVNISGNVTEVNAWIIATGALNTCSDYKPGETQTTVQNYDNTDSATCSKQLKIVGPVFANKVNLRRSYGSDPTLVDSWRYTPGEIFNLSAINYLWAYAQAGRYKSSYTEAYVRELAPRY